MLLYSPEKRKLARFTLYDSCSLHLGWWQHCIQNHLKRNIIGCIKHGVYAVSKTYLSNE